MGKDGAGCMVVGAVSVVSGGARVKDMGHAVSGEILEHTDLCDSWQEAPKPRPVSLRKTSELCCGSVGVCFVAALFRSLWHVDRFSSRKVPFPLFDSHSCGGKSLANVWGRSG